VTATGLNRLPDLVRYLRGLDRRLDKLPADPVRDRARAVALRGLEGRYVRLLELLGDDPVPEEVIELGWLLEELRVSAFAQNLGTSRPVSEARLARELDRLGAPA
jgi:ATP-dependent helicase HrpA